MPKGGMIMKNLKENSICANGTITVCWPQCNEKIGSIDMTEIGSKFNDAYCINNSTICFVVDHEVFVTPYTREAMATIKKAGLAKKDFYVPFSNWDYPKNEEAKWSFLCKTARESYRRDFENDCIKWCDQHNISGLDDEILKHCFRMPLRGVSVRSGCFEDTYYPICHESCMDATVINKLGRYCTNNSIVVFVHNDGRTYVTRGYWILEELYKAGYRESNLFVPFSNGEKIIDPTLAAEWKN